MGIFEQRKARLTAQHDALVNQRNERLEGDSGVFNRWRDPVVTADHVPLTWRYDFSADSNPFFSQRLGVNATFNAGAIKWQGRYLLAVRVEGYDRKSFFAIAESESGVDQFRFWEHPIVVPQTSVAETNVYDMRLVAHEDGWVYGLFCAERADPDRPSDVAAAVATCGIVRTRDLITWQRLPDLVTHSGQQRNVVLHPEFVNSCYGFYTRPQAGFIEVGAGGGIGWGLSQQMVGAEIKSETIVDHRVYHTIKEAKNGLGPAPIKTAEGWLHLAHGVRDTAAGLRYVLYLFVTDLKKPWKIIYQPGGFLLAPIGDERVGDVSNVVFSNGWIADDNGDVYLYYGSSDTRLHVATTTISQLLDYAKNTPEDALISSSSVEQRLALINHNNQCIGSEDG